MAHLHVVGSQNRHSGLDITLYYIHYIIAWKIQESSKGILIQLVWKQTPVCASESGNFTRVGTNWKAAVVSSKDCSKSGKPASEKISPFIARRSARRLQAFLDRKQLAQVDSQKELDSKGVESVLPKISCLCFLMKE